MAPAIRGFFFDRVSYISPNHITGDHLVPTQLQDLEARIASCCKDIEATDETSMRALRMAERIRAAQGAQRRDMLSRLEELRIRVEELERRRR